MLPKGDSPMKRLALLTFAIGLVQFITPASAEYLYKFNGGATLFNGGQQYTGPVERDALIALDISNGTVTGQLRPLLGDRTAPINVRGTNPQDGVLDLIVDLPTGPKSYKFTKSV